METAEFYYVYYLAHDYLQYVLQESHLGPAQTRVAHVLRNIASSLQDQTEEALRPFLDRIDITSVDVAKRIFNGVMEEKFADGNTNWGRIMTIFTFGGLLTKKLQEHGVQLTGEEKERISYFITEYIINNKAEWIDANGGWKNLEGGKKGRIYLD
ncbi:bcl-2-related protein A1 isoform X2 [Struthio camelus]|uniref:bcl-2-related protein A1 isoform X2 n=1 Tax=Struthio camelus TaxID=8801 RepID=UPI003603E0FD